MKKYFLILIIGVLLLSVTSDIQKKIIRENGFDIEFYVHLKKLKSFDSEKDYYWFKSGNIYNTKGGIGGFVLHDSYSKFFRSNQIAEKGNFDYGLKNGDWNIWHENGKLKSQTKWKKGFKNGSYRLYDENGVLEWSGKFSKNRKSGTWINHKSKDTLFYKKDEPLKERPIGFFERVFSKKDSVTKAENKKERMQKKIEREKKDTFFKRLFKKKS